ncbi:DEAD/DEAH box helicase family protein [Spirosoma soli]|uniref:DEAD/DEAH box helicase family protein n=1 Tax=Spirosoma soli TaxID=1770529 RepID=A0ABW5M9V5_9BACT
MWDLERGNPQPIQTFPTTDSFKHLNAFHADPQRLANEPLDVDYIALTQRPDYQADPRWIYEAQRERFKRESGLRFLRDYQLKAVKKLQEAVADGKDRFLFEMATGTGKTLTSAAVVKLFLRTGNARRVLFLVDRLELENQAKKDFDKYLKPDYITVIYKEKRDDWRKAEVVVSTVQSFSHHNKYKRLFRPDDFDLVISDEAHRSIGGNSRAVFDYFVGYKLGLTATPKDYLKKVNTAKLQQRDPRELERRMLLDTYTTFGCENGIPTFRFSLLDGVKAGYLVNPTVVDARTSITTQLLSEEGYAVLVEDKDGNETEASFVHRDFEKKFFSETTNYVFCETFLKNALRDPVSGEVGKTIIFCVSQNHAARVTQLLNEQAHRLFPGRYRSDFAVQVTSNVTDAQQMTINFANNQLGGSGNYNPDYRTSRTRVCVTVGMMTTGYDCPDLLNLCLMRPVFSPSEFVQMKGRGTRKHNFTGDTLADRTLANQLGDVEKTTFKLFDFFANCEYFEEKFNYDEVIKLPAINKPDADPTGGLLTPLPDVGAYENESTDRIHTVQEQIVGLDGMKIDRMYFDQFEERVKQDPVVQNTLQTGDWDTVLAYVADTYFDKPAEFYNLDKLRRAAQVDRRISLREIVEKVLGLIPYFKSKEELLEDEFDKFDSRYLPNEEYFTAAKNFFKSYVTDGDLREIIETRKYSLLNTNPNGDSFRHLPPELRKQIPEYIKDNISLNQFMA